MTADGSQSAESANAMAKSGRAGVAWLVVGATVAVCSAWTLHDLVQSWITTENVALGMMVAVAVGFLLWDRREILAREPVRPSASGWPLLLFAGVLLVFGTRAGLVFGGVLSVFLRGLALLGILWGLVLIYWGWPRARFLILPTVLLLFAFPENYLTAYWVPLRLQTLTAVLSEKIVALLGDAVVREGHVIQTSTFTANVVEACSGIRSLNTVVPTALFIGAYALRRPGAKVALAVLSVPLTIAANVLRVTLTVLLGTHVSREVAEGFFHYFAGVGIFVFCLVGLLVLMQILRLTEQKPRGLPVAGAGSGPGEEDEAPAPVPAANVHLTLPAPGKKVLFVIAVLLLLILAQGFDLHKYLMTFQRYADAPLAGIPKQVGIWTGQDQEIDKAVREIRKPTDMIYRHYSAPGRPDLDVLVLYWKPERGSIFARRLHGPEICSTYQGMKELWVRRRMMPTGKDGRTEVEVSYAVYELGGARMLATWWQETGAGSTGERVEPHGYMAKILFGLRTVWTANLSSPEVSVQLLTPLVDSVERAEEIARVHAEFAREFAPAATACLRPIGR